MSLSLGIFWRNRPETMREYAKNLKDLLSTLKGKPFLLNDLTWVGNGTAQEARIADDLSNLDNLIFKFAADPAQVYCDNTGPCDTATWNATGAFGYLMSFHNGRSSKQGGISITVNSGLTDKDQYNFINIKFPRLTGKDCSLEVNNYSFLKTGFTQLIEGWRPEIGRIMLPSFSDRLTESGFSDIGWLTYIKNSSASAMRNNPDLIAAGIEMEPVSIGGTLFSIDREMVSPDNEVQVARARLLRTKLMENHLIDS